jgi:hypothetical protein
VADDKETQNSLPTGETFAAQLVKYTTAKQYAEDKRTDTLVAVNATPARRINGPVKLPKLQESTQTGYKGGPKNSFSVLCCTVGRHFIEKNTAYDYIMMATAAAQDGITLRITEAFRDMERQKQLYNERLNPVVAKKDGVAAAPGYSNHQQGIALDIDVKMSKQMYIDKTYSAEFLWLKGNGTSAAPGHAAEYGFSHAEGAHVNEPWHWVHPKAEILAPTAFQSATGFSVLTAETALAAANLNQSGTKRAANQIAHDHTVGLARSTSMQRSSRAALQSEHALFAANQSNGQSNTVGQAEATTLEVEPTAFDSTTLSAFSYNFDTGKWEDGEPV